MIKNSLSKQISAFILILLLLVGVTSYAQNSGPSGKLATNTDFAFKLYPTTNMWTFLKLDSRTGKIWQVQYSVDGDEHRLESTLNDVDLTSVTGGDAINGRYELYPTQNMYNFILLDRVKGTSYQVQWNIDIDKRGIWFIGFNGDN